MSLNPKVVPSVSTLSFSILSVLNDYVDGSIDLNVDEDISEAFINFLTPKEDKHLKFFRW